MVCINYHQKELTFKIVYYGAKGSGKSAHLNYLKKHFKSGVFSLIKDEAGNTIIDSLHISLGTVNQFHVKYHFYCVSGEKSLKDYRKQILKEADGVIFIADSGSQKNAANIDSLKELLAHLTLENAQIPVVIQYNKRDLPLSMNLFEMEKELNYIKTDSFESNALDGTSVFASLKTLSNKIISNVA